MKCGVRFGNFSPSPGDFVELLKKNFETINYDVEENSISGSI